MEEGLRRAGEAEVGCDDRRRFELELEFLHCLANPGYLNFLAQNRYFEDPAFLQYLQYLQYWQQPQYARFIIYPHALYFLDLLQTPEFRAKIANPAYKELVHTQQFFYWQHARANRMREKEAADTAAAAAAAGQQQQPLGANDMQQQQGQGQPIAAALVKDEPAATPGTQVQQQGAAGLPPEQQPGPVGMDVGPPLGVKQEPR